ncbi:TetR-like C-terminal domain-containing protein [Actinosynnema sp. NPDC023658]|uniref:TetR-like C-terminal domain-containing protein n=1 Tax=Actinosynnema sp. NPDC023658 TaxID=3155465 RepID=UPI0033F50634
MTARGRRAFDRFGFEHPALVVLRPEVTVEDNDFLIDLVHGPMWYHLLFGHEELTDEYADRVVDTVLSAATRP